MDDIKWLLDHGYVLSVRNPGLCNMVVDGLGKRARNTDGQYMVFDPNDDADGYILIGDNLEELCAEARRDLEAKCATRTT